MAYVTCVKTVYNESPYTIFVDNGEDTSRNFQLVPTENKWLNWGIPWIGREDESYKRLKFTSTQPFSKALCIYQDYWKPADANEVKYTWMEDFSYEKANGRAIGGDPDGGGNRNMIIKVDPMYGTLSVSLVRVP
ncbi:hypothetical protein ACFSE0_11200 [Ochrobactrum teleogrylli]|uniref:Uncharacterized protein n=1 Tax=Ochrobactrum teleogrylli TaxID=2479765 RepID=A0ABY2XZ81_9HYPH|nr:hypothetical protein [[Ochrobactrum] teleogrylli]TNV09202.1 hypothetical protein FIC94_22210 [[Ochrobactrum] teleogrylli]